MTDYKSLPAWKRAMSIARSVYACVDEAGMKQSEPGKRLRKAAVSVPSLIAEAFLDVTGRDEDEALFLAGGRLSEVARLLGEANLTDPDRVSLLSEIELLTHDLEDLKAARATN